MSFYGIVIGCARLGIQLDGKVYVYGFGTEMGQGLDTKMNQIAAAKLGVSTTKCEWQMINSDTLPKGSEFFLPPTAASSGSDLNGQAILLAGDNLNAWLQSQLQHTYPDIWQAYVANGNKWYRPAQWKDGVQISPEVDIWPTAISALTQLKLLPYATELAKYDDAPNLKDLDAITKVGHPYWYFSYAAAISCVEIDALTGEFYILFSNIIFDCGISLNPAIDIGQMEGGLAMGIGFSTCEELQFKDTPNTPTDPGDRGTLLSTNTWFYKMPTTTEIPKQLNVCKSLLPLFTAIPPKFICMFIHV